MDRLSAMLENREFFFELKSKHADRIVVNMYSTEYAFVQEKGKWVNANSNVNTMAPGLIAGVMKALSA